MPHVRRGRLEPVALASLPGTYVEPPADPHATPPEVYQRYLEMPMAVRDHFHAYLRTHHDMDLPVDGDSLTKMLDAAEQRYEQDTGEQAPSVPWTPAPTVHDQVVYYLQFAAMVKIGTSANVRHRLQQLPHDRLLALEWGDRHVESIRHQQFAAHRRNGEWFHLVPDLVTHARTVRERFEAGVAMNTEEWVERALAR